MTQIHPLDDAVADEIVAETVEMILDTTNAVGRVLAEVMPSEELDALLRELAVGLVDVASTVTTDLNQGVAR